MKATAIKKINFLFFFLLITATLHAQQNCFKLFLVGDAGENATTGKTLESLQQKLNTDSNSAVIFLGDNCYKGFLFGINKLGFKGYDGSALTKKKIMSQINILNQYKGSAYFIPGNHDWWNLNNIKRGKKSLLMEEKFIESSINNIPSVKNHSQATFLPANGEPGPVSEEFNQNKLRIIYIDTHRLILAALNNSDKENKLLQTFYNQLDSTISIAANAGQKIVIVGHHPLYAKGNHSGFPKGFGKLSARTKTSCLKYPPYWNVASKTDSILKKYNSATIYYVSGHEHSLEYFYKDSIHYIITGAGSKTDKVNKPDATNENEYLTWNQEGYFEIDFYDSRQTIILSHRKKEEDKMTEKCLSGCD
jgi:hypothetical protein